MREPPIWIATPEALEALARGLAGAPAVAVDTETDSLHHYPERLCLLQLADDGGRVYFVDPLALPHLEPLRALFADPATVKVLHSAENDLAHLKRRYGITVAGLFDTLVAARLLGLRALGLAALLEQYLGVKPVASQQKTDWARRPLTPAQEAYAAEDVRHLLALRQCLLAELEARGRAAWVAEECEALAAAPAPERPAEADGSRRIRGAAALDPRGRAVLRALDAQREAWARAEQRPPFKVLSPEALVALAAARPRTWAELASVPGLTARQRARYGEGLLQAVERGLAEPLVPPGRDRSPRRVVPPAARGRAEALRRWRTAAAERFGLDPGVLLPQRLIHLLAAEPPRDVAGLAALPGFRRWRAQVFGAELLEVLDGTARGTAGGRRDAD